MDTKYINDKLNSIFSREEYKNLSKDTVKQLFKLCEGFEFDDNDNLRLFLARINQAFIASFYFAWSQNMLSSMNDDRTKNYKKL